MRNIQNQCRITTLAAALALFAAPVTAQVLAQCPGDTNGNARLDPGETADPKHPNAKCMHLAAGDGYIRLADGKPMYTFGFSDVTGKSPSQVMSDGLLNANFPAPLIAVDEGDELYLSVTNVGMLIRPDLFDAHTVHFHGFPNASAVFDGLPDSGIAILHGATLSYYYNIVEPGTYMYHCHVEATEHMQMGMLGNLYVRPAQNKRPDGTNLGGFTHHTGYKYAYNDGDGSTFYNSDYAIQIGSMDSNFHDLHEAVQPLPFALMRDTYPMLNGRGYPDTAQPGDLAPPPDNANFGRSSQKQSSRITASAGQKILLRISDLNVTRFYTLQTTGISMRVVGKDARLLRGPDGKNLAYLTNSVTVGGGESVDAILDIPASATPGTRYFLHAAELNYLTNHDEVSAGMGGMLTEIVVN